MKYVFYQVFYSSSAPKAAEDVIRLMKRCVGSEMLKSYYAEFVGMLGEEVSKANAAGKHSPLKVDVHSEVHYDDNRRHGQVYVYQDGKWGAKDVARLEWVEVDSMWFGHVRDGLKQLTFTEYDRFKQKLDDFKKRD